MRTNKNYINIFQLTALCVYAIYAMFMRHTPNPYKQTALSTTFSNLYQTTAPSINMRVYLSILCSRFAQLIRL